MSTNKTYTVIEDHNSSSTPDAATGVFVFDEYNDAMSFGKTYVMGIGAGQVLVRIWNNNRACGYWIKSGTNPSFVEQTYYPYP